MKSNLADSPRLDDEESLFSRDVAGRLIRLDKVTSESFDQDVTLAIDDRVIRVKRAVPAVDSQGNPRRDAMGLAVPRATTIYDAAAALTDAVPIRDADGRLLEDEKGRVIHRPRIGSDPETREPGTAPNPIPILCHLPHLEPVAVCRACVVEISRVKRGERRTERKLLPACQHRVEDAMEVRTIASSKKVEAAVMTVVELLVADHPSPCEKERRHTGDCELEALARRLGVTQARFASRAPRPTDDSSLLVAVDHSACIMCDRCTRGCNDVKNNQVIGKMLKGYEARIAFDLDAPMGQSSCVSCGECMVSCPTGALTFRQAIDTTVFDDLDPPAVPVELEDLLNHPDPRIRRAFCEASPTFLRFNAKSVARRTFAPGRIICRQGEYGSTAYLIERGSADIFIKLNRPAEDMEPRGGFLGLFRGRRTAPDGRAPARRFIPTDGPTVLPADRPEATLGVGDLFGEMSCLNAYPRSASARAGAEGCTVLEMQRNVLDILRRSRSYREEMDGRVRKRVTEVVLQSVPMLSGAAPEFIAELSRTAHYRRCEPGEVILAQGAPAVGGDPETEGLFFIRSGYLRITRVQAGGRVSLNYRGPGNYVGELGLLAGLSDDDLGSEAPTLAQSLHEVRRLTDSGRRIATCVALDHMELVRIPPDAFQRIFRAAPAAVRRTIIADAMVRLRETFPVERDPRGTAANQDSPEGAVPRESLMREFLDQGLMGAQSLLVLDLLKCTRCDECTKACAETHRGIDTLPGVPRLLRDGLRFDKYLIASSCRSCHDPVCLIGCPVDAIHRRPGSIEIRIDDHCIGCGKCAENCPYGNINMHELTAEELRAKGLEAKELPGSAPAAVGRRATTCDQCRSLNGHAPNCVVACPHDAAHRMQGHELFRLVERATAF